MLVLTRVCVGLQNQVPEEPKAKRAPRELNEKQREAKKLRDEIRQQEIDVRALVLELLGPSGGEDSHMPFALACRNATS